MPVLHSKKKKEISLNAAGRQNGEQQVHPNKKLEKPEQRQPRENEILREHTCKSSAPRPLNVK